jgi:NAD(P)-dependent dehydrogenase (short-subunit alcohol dehydrogenase family)
VTVWGRRDKGPAAAFAGRVVLVTGAASGLGQQLTRELTAAGAVVGGVDRNASALQALAAELAGRRFASQVADVTHWPQLHAAVHQLEALLGPWDLLLACAGIGQLTPAADFRPEVVEEIIRVNLVGVANSIAAVLPSMRARRRGQLAVISSLASYRGLPWLSAYCASKAGVNALLEGLRAELRPLDIDVTILCPGWVRTPMTAAAPLPLPHLLAVEEAARHILQAVARRRPFYAFPAPLRRRLRLLRWLPASLSDWLLARSWRPLRSVRSPSAGATSGESPSPSL